MRVLFVSVPWPTNFHAMVPLAWAMRAVGHEVRVASGPALTGAIGDAGLQAVVTGPDFDFLPLFRRRLGEMYDLDWSALTTGEGEERATGILRIFAEISDRMADELVDFGRAWRPDLVIYEPTMVAGPLVAAVLGVPAVRHLWGPDITYGSDHLQRPLLRPMTERFGLAELCTLGALTIDTAPASLQLAAPVRRQPMRYIPYNGPGEIPRSLAVPREPGAPPRVLVTWGTAMSRMGRPEVFLLPDAVAALHELQAGAEVEVMLAIAPDQRDLLGETPPDVTVLESVPLHTVLPTCSAVVHHGGSGTTLTAVAAGLPQLIVSQSPDQVHNALRVDEAGAGLMFIPREGGARAVRAELGHLARRLLDEPEFGANARRLRAESEAQPSPWEVVTVLERLAREAVPA